MSIKSCKKKNLQVSILEIWQDWECKNGYFGKKLLQFLSVGMRGRGQCRSSAFDILNFREAFFFLCYIQAMGLMILQIQKIGRGGNFQMQVDGKKIFRFKRREGSILNCNWGTKQKVSSFLLFGYFYACNRKISVSFF